MPIKKGYKKFKISKKNGSFREIYAPNKDYKDKLREINKNLTLKVEKFNKDGVIHGFLTNKNVVTNAMEHIGYEYTLSLDLSNFFDSVTVNKVDKYLNAEEKEYCFIDDVARQGLPTSPAIANLAFLKCDKAILKFFKKHKINAAYTRYADDLTFSFNKIEEKEIIEKTVSQIAKKAGFAINLKKTKLQSAKGGRRIITGIGVDFDEVYPTRKILKKIRAAQHQDNLNSLNGLKGFAQCKKPKSAKEKEEINNLYKLFKHYHISFAQKDIKIIPKKTTIELENSCVISGDPIDMAGMSSFTTGWKSCMRLSGGAYKKGIPFWIMLKGTRIAYEKSDKTKRIGDFERNQMISRTLVHELRNGVLVYDKFYGNNIETLKRELEKYGVISMTQAKELYLGEKVKGNVPVRYKPYFDNLKSGTGIRKNTKMKIRYAYI